MLRTVGAGALCALPLLVSAFSAPPVQAADGFAIAMETAAAKRHVPLAVIQATAYVNTQWEWISTTSAGGGVGPMNVTRTQMSLATSLSGHTATEITGDAAANVDAGAALLAHYHTTGTDLASWQPALVATQGKYVSQEIFSVMRNGASKTTSEGERIVLAPQSVPSSVLPASPRSVAGASSVGADTTLADTDYPNATWIPANSANYSVANRAHDYPIDLIVIHDIEGSAGSAIQTFQNPARQASAHYVVSYQGAITQMVREKDIAWHAGNWDYNTRAIGIEHEGFAYQNLYTTTEYDASAALAASICSRWGVLLDRSHVIGHYQVPDPNNPGLFGGSSHHTDPGPYWNWTYYMNKANQIAATLPSPPHMMPDPVATNSLTGITVSWSPARTCRPTQVPITGYTVVGQPGNLTQNVSASTRSVTFDNLTPGTVYTFTVTGTNGDGQDSATTNPTSPGRCNTVRITTSPGSPQKVGTSVSLGATASNCQYPRYQFMIQRPGSSSWDVAQAFSAISTYSWRTGGLTGGWYDILVLAKDVNSAGNYSNSLGTYDDSRLGGYNLLASPCTAVRSTASPGSPTMRGAPVTFNSTASGCPAPQYQYWIRYPNGAWHLGRGFAGDAFSWNTSGLPLGTYTFSVWGKDVSSAGTHVSSSGRYDAYGTFTYALTAGCPSVSVSASPGATTRRGTTVNMTAKAHGCASSTPLYQYWVLYPGSSTWRKARAYSTTATFSWHTTGLPAGTYRFSVWVMNSTGVHANSLGRYDAATGFTYRLS